MAMSLLELLYKKVTDSDKAPDTMALILKALDFIVLRYLVVLPLSRITSFKRDFALAAHEKHIPLLRL